MPVEEGSNEKTSEDASSSADSGAGTGLLKPHTYTSLNVDFYEDNPEDRCDLMDEFGDNGSVSSKSNLSDYVKEEWMIDSEMLWFWFGLDGVPCLAAGKEPSKDECKLAAKLLGKLSKKKCKRTDTEDLTQ